MDQIDQAIENFIAAFKKMFGHEPKQSDFTLAN